MIASLQSRRYVEFDSNPMTITAVFFDAAGTLIKPTRRVGESYSIVARRYGIDIAPSEISQRFASCFRSAPPLAFPDASAAEIADLEWHWWEQLVERIFEPWGRFKGFDDYFAELFAYFAQPDAWTLYPEVLATLSALKIHGTTLAVISNFDSRLLKILDGLGVSRCFEQVFVSSRVGHAKPSREIFEAALNANGVKAENALHVGDSEENDFHGATNAGLRGLLVNRDSENHAKTPQVVSNLRDILSFVND
jgi:putative hydrolase of the HAD superfamily